MLDKGNPPDDWATLLQAASTDMARHGSLQRMVNLDLEAGSFDDHTPLDRS
jgi:toxin YhaV